MSKPINLIDLKEATEALSRAITNALCRETEHQISDRSIIDTSIHAIDIAFRPGEEQAIPLMQRSVHELAITQGWWDEPRNDGELLALIHSELSECLEALRQGNPPSTVITGSHACEEMADAVIRIMDMCEARGWDLGRAIREKHEFNKTRVRKHGKAF